MKKGLYLIFDIKAISLIFAFAVSCVILSVAVAANKTVSVSNFNLHSKPVVIIDAGHGGEDGGTQSADGMLEKNINLSIAFKLEKILRQYGFSTVMIRDSDKMIYSDTAKTVRERKTSDLHNRMKIMKQFPGSIFLSIHQNHFSESKYSGAQVFYSKRNADSSVLAEFIQQSIVSSLQKDNTRKTKPCPSSVYLIYNAVTTAVMVECGFLSNAEEAKKLAESEYQYAMARAIANGLYNYINTKGS